MSLVGDNIRRIRRLRGLQQKEVALALDMDASNYSKIERGAIAWTQASLEQIAAVLKVDLFEFFITDATVEVAGQLRGKPVQVWDDPPSDLPLGKPEILKNWTLVGEMTVSTDHPIDLMILMVRGPSMEPRFKDGDAVVLDRSLKSAPGDFVLAVDDRGIGMFRRYRALPSDAAGNPVFALVPMSKDYPTLRSSHTSLIVYATMIEHRRFRRNMSDRY